jgi:hypothetical protein
MITEIFGYFSLAIIGLSMMMNDLLVVRIVNIIGFVFLGYYGYLSDSVFIIIMSILLFTINMIKIIKDQNN